MVRPTVGSSLFILASCAFAQTASTPLAFEAASIKLAPPPVDGRVMRRMSGGPGSTDPGRITLSNVTLKMLVTQGYNLKEFQVEGPDWIDSVGFDIIATMPPGTTQEQASEMMRTLLAERFKFASHFETKQLPVFGLVVAKGGPKMAKAAVQPPVSGSAAGPAGGRGGAPGGPSVRMSATPSGIQLNGTMTMAQLANQLTRQMGRPVLDQTELTATYDVSMTWMPDDLSRIGPGGSLPGGAGEAPREAKDPTMTLPRALQEMLGLKLDPRKSSAEVLMIDHAEKTPVEN